MIAEREIIVGLLLAAGFARRFGSDKLLATLPDGVPVAVAAARHLVAAIPQSIAVVRPSVSALDDALRAEGLRVVPCEEAIHGMGASLACAVRAAGPAAGYVVALADMPYIAPSTIQAVAAALIARDLIVAPSFGKKRGHPVGLPGRYYAELIALDGDEGARRLIERDGVELLEIEDEGPMRDFFDRRISAEAAHFGRWRERMPPPEARRVDRRYRRLIRSLRREGVWWAPAPRDEPLGLSPARIAASARSLAASVGRQAS